MALSDAQRALLLDALVDPKPFYGHGVHELPAYQLLVFQKKDPVWVDLSKGATTDDDLAKLAAACQPATFGLNKEDVLDESYRKAGKLDNTDFATNLDVFGSGLLEKVHDALFGWEAEARDITAELYKMNVYRPGSFFKAHKDTPRATNMFGSLVLTFPTRHEGGQLVLRHDGQEHIHDTGCATYDADHQVSWVAFFSDVEHEVLPVSSGHRVTLTYNLYFTPRPPRVRPVVSDRLLEVFKALLADKTFVPDGGRLGFGLKHQYPVPASEKKPKEKSSFLKDTTSALKAGDSALFNAAESAGLAPKLRLLYSLDDGDGGKYLFKKVWSGCNGELPYEYMIKEFEKQEKIAPAEWDEEDAPKPAPDLEWVVEHNEKTRVPSQYVAHGNEASIDTVYGDLVMIAMVPPASKRS